MVDLHFKSDITKMSNDDLIKLRKSVIRVLNKIYKLLTERISVLEGK